MDTILTLFAHPDDETNAMGGTLWLLKDHYRILMLCLTRGERGLSPGYVEVSSATAAIREAELRAAARLLGAEVRFLDRIDGEVYADRAICERVAAILAEVGPVAFFGMWPIDMHPDHAAASEIARKAMRLSGYAGEFWMIEEGLGQTAQFEPDLCVDISGVQEEKARLIRCHACQNTDDRMVSEMAAIARFRGAKAGCTAAEGFASLLSRRAGQRSILERIATVLPA